MYFKEQNYRISALAVANIPLLFNLASIGTVLFETFFMVEYFATMIWGSRLKHWTHNL